MSTITIFSGSPSGEIVETTINKPELVDDQLYIRITASGLCGTDIHALHRSNCLGHEGIVAIGCFCLSYVLKVTGCGIIEAIGPAVKKFKLGDRVGFGYLRNACGRCKQCLSGDEIFCEERDTYDSPAESTRNFGSLASHTVWREAFVFELPSNISDEEAAPLMCGGATVFNALNKYDVNPTESIGIVGIGGLGHLAIQFAAKMGCEVTVFSGTNSKRQEAIDLGATHFIATKGAEKLDLGGTKLDRLLITTSSQPGMYMPVGSLIRDFRN
jgi:D-arabinose 1-dehydrogenase-like Zn-dependent alcohol dehydrogenase